MLNIIKKRKNEIVNNELSNYFRGRRLDYERLFRFEGKCANALENEWANAFYLGLMCKDRVTEEQLRKIRDKEKDIEMELFGGFYDKDRVISEILCSISPTEKLKETNRIILAANMSKICHFKHIINVKERLCIYVYI